MSLIFVVEDNALSRELVRDLLTAAGHEVAEATTASEARAWLGKGRLPDAILLDVQIPGGGGEALLAEIRAEPSLRTIPVLAVTAQAMQGDRERFLRLGFSDYIPKPIHTRAFAATIATHLSKR